MKTSTSLILGSILVLATLVVTAAFTLPTLKKTEEAEVKKEVVSVPVYTVNSKAKEASPETYSEEAFKILKAVGLTKSKTYNDIAKIKSLANAPSIVKKWSNLGFTFYDDASFEDTLRINKLSTVWTSSYKGTIPEKNIFEIANNFEKLIATKENLYFAVGGDDWHLRKSNSYDEYVIYIAAPDSEIVPDPIAVVKVDGGWVQLSRW